MVRSMVILRRENRKNPSNKTWLRHAFSRLGHGLSQNWSKRSPVRARIRVDLSGISDGSQKVGRSDERSSLYRCLVKSHESDIVPHPEQLVYSRGWPLRIFCITFVRLLSPGTITNIDGWVEKNVLHICNTSSYVHSSLFI